MLLYLQEAAQIDALTREGGVFISAEARLAGPGRVDVGPRQLESAHIVIATGGRRASRRTRGRRAAASERLHECNAMLWVSEHGRV